MTHSPDTRRRGLIAVVGATGTGKTALGIEIAVQLAAHGQSAEIVNADAMQMYRGMDIGTAKASVDDRRGVLHHMLDVCDVTEEASVAWYQSEARLIIEEVWARDTIPILVGGSGLYVSSVLFDFDFPGHDDAVRERLEREDTELGTAALFARLRARAPDAATLIDPKNSRRVIRALEVLELSGDASGLGHLEGQSTLWAADTMIVSCVTSRDVLVERLDARVEQMWLEGLVDEVSSLTPLGLAQGVTASRAIGYAQALAQLSGTMTESAAIAETQQLTRRLARRQVSWFKRYPSDVQVDTSIPESPVVDGRQFGSLEESANVIALAYLAR